MGGDKGRDRGKRVFKGLGVALVALLGMGAFLYVEVAMTSTDLDDPSQMRTWLLLVTGIIGVGGGLFTLIARA